ncbi:MAG: putative Ig domain-containing protein [Scytonema sp. PMC 1069.18]|nr:putative Ig domain-containing protein [Scytonema sp. PMC 1069.18]
MNQIVSSTISKRGENDTYTFNGVSGQQIYFDALNANDPNFTVRLYTPSGLELYSGPVQNDLGPDTIIIYNDVFPGFTLTETGTYRLVVDGNGEATGDYNFRVLNYSDAFELTFENNATQLITGSFGSDRKETDIYRISGTQGQYIYIDNIGGSYDDYWTLYGPGGQVVTGDRVNDDGELALPTTGEYILAMHGSGSGNANYTFKVTTPELKTTFLEQLNLPVSGTIGLPGEKDTYTFNGTIGQRLFFDGWSGSSSIRGRLISPTGVEILNNATDADSIPLTLTEAGIYRLVIDGDTDTTGNYSFRLSDIAMTSALQMGTAISNHLSPGHEVDLYRFIGSAGQQLSFNLDAESWSSANWVLYGTDNQVLASPAQLSPDFNVMLKANGLYTLAIHGSSSEAVNYSFTVTDNTPSKVATTGLGAVQNGTISANHVTTQTFSATAGTRIYFDSQLANNTPLIARLMNPDGTEVFAISTSTDSEPIQLQQTGTYTLLIQGTDDTATGSYQFALIDLPTETPSLRGDRRVLQFSAEVTKPLEPGRLMHDYSFTGVAGQQLFYDGMFTDGATVGTDTVTARLISPTGNTIFNPGYLSGYSTADIGPFTLTETGTYNLLLSGEKDTPTGYRFRLWDLADARSMELNKQVKENLLRGNDTNLYKFTGTAGQRLYFDGISGSDARWKLYRPGDRSVLADHYITDDFELLLPTDGEYILAVSGYGNTPTQYGFQVISTKAAASIVTPGEGESNKSGEDSGTYRVRIDVTDGRGCKAIQDYKIRVAPEPGNHAPTIITDGVKAGFSGWRYVYDVDASDADGDTLTYRLMDAPRAMFIDDVTGKIIWSSPEVGTHQVTVRVEDGRGGVDTQTIDLVISDTVPGTVKGTVYADIDSDGKRDLTNPNNMTPDNRVVIGETFKDIYTAYNLGTPNGVPHMLGGMTFKRNADGTVDFNTILIGGAADSCGGVIMELKVQRGDGGHIIGFDDDDESATPYVANYYAYAPYIDAGLVYYTSSHKLLASSVKGSLRGLQEVPFGLPGALQLKSTGANNTFSTVNYSPDGSITSIEIETTVGDRPGGFVYMPVTAPKFETGASILLAEWNNDSINAYEVDSEGNPIASTKQLFIGNYDGATGAVVDPVTGDLLFNAMGGENNVMVVRGLGKAGANEIGLANWLVYVDADADGVRDADELFTYTDAQGNYSFTLAPGTYRIAQEVQPGWTQTAPTQPNYWSVTIAASDRKFGIDFGNTNSNLSGENVAPEFTSTPVTSVTVGEKLLYQATANDLNADELTFELVLKPEGMAVAPNSTISWRPGNHQVGKHQVIVRALDGNGGINLQAFEVEVLQGNRAPVFTSIAPEVARVRETKLFSYQAKALDLDGDTITYSLVVDAPNTPVGLSINSTTGQVEWTPTAQQMGGSLNPGYTSGVEPWQILIRATDGKGGEAFQSLNVIVDPLMTDPTDPTTTINRAPEITSTPRTTTRLGNSYLYEIEATDPDGDALSYSLLSKPEGMTISDGAIVWTPTPDQFGNNSVVLRVSDSQAVIEQSFTINVSNIAMNRAPSITSTPNTLTNLEKEYQYNLSGSDPDGDLLLWSLSAAPSGMVIDARSGALRWNPTSTQIGEHTVAVQLTDALGGYTTQEFTLEVTGINAPPTIVSNPVTRAALNQPYSYTVVASDPENDALTFNLGKTPSGMTIDDNGAIQWTPQGTQVGSHSVEVFVTDALGATSTQTYTIVVSETAINNAPVITSTPVFVASVGSAYNYQVVATDSDAGDRLTYQLLSAPADVTGITIDATTGLLTWNNPVAGNYRIVVGAVDDGGLGAAQSFNLTARANNEPVIRSTPVLTATPGSVYGYDIIASDVDGDRLTYTLDTASLNKGITLDTLGRLRWNLTVSNVGTHHIVLSLSDGITSTPQQYDLVVAADTEAPKVRLIANYDLINLGETVIFQARATDNIQVAGKQLLINDTPFVLDGNGMARFTPTTAGTIRAVAVATDTAGNIGQATFDVAAIDTSDVNAPVVSLNLGTYAGSLVTAPIDIKGSLSDDGQLDYYKLLVAPVAGGEFKEILFVDNPNAFAEGGASPIADGVLGKFDPSLLQNDSYILRLEVADNDGNISYSESVVDVAGDLKLGNFRLSFTDLSIPVTGIPITLTRTYDTLTSGMTDDFGYGWRMEFRDTDLRTSLKPPTEEDQLIGYQSAFKDGTRVYITLPGGKREAFTFKPTIDSVFKYLATASADINGDPYVYKPTFVGVMGVTSTLTVKDARILHKAGTSEYVGLNGGVPYNPADVNFGNIYVLTTKDGIVYEIDAQTGDLLTVADTNGNKLTYSDAGIVSSTGKQITFERDAIGRIAAVKDPMGELIRYEYDPNGNLVSVTDRENNTTRLEYNQQRQHYLDKIIDPLGRTGVRNEYGEDGRLKKIVDVNGLPVEMTYDLDASEQKVTDQLGNVTTYVYDTRGNVVTEIDALGKITKRKYNDDNDVLERTVISDRSGSDGFTKKYTYDNFGNMLTESDPLGNVTYYTYGQYSRLLTEVDTLGNATIYTYSSKGRLRSMTDAAGNITKYGYDLKGNLTEIVDVNGNTTQFRYDTVGNIESAIDAQGNAIIYTYNANGKRLSETQTVTTSQGLQKLVSELTYDREGRVTSVKDPLQNVTKYEFDNNGNQTAVINARHNQTEYRYNSKGQIVETISPDNTENNSLDNPRTITIYDEGGRSRATIDQNGEVTHYEYDALGRVTKIIYPSATENTLAQLIAAIAPGETLDSIDWTLVVYPKDSPAYLVNNPYSSTEYYQDGLVKAEIDERGNRTEYRYNALGQLIETIYPDRTPQNLSDNPRTRHEYDSSRRLISTTDALGRTTTFVYDQLGRLKQTNYSDDTSTTTTFDANGRVIARTDKAGRTTKYKYNSVGKLIETIYPDDTIGSDEDNPKTHNEYDEIGRKIALIDERGNRTEYEYDKAGRQTLIRDALHNETKYTYDEVGNQLTKTDALNHTTSYVYDEQERLVKTHFADLTYTTTVYDNSNQVIAKTDQDNQTTQYEYDSRGRLTAVIDARQQRTEYGYDLTGNLVSTKDANGHITTYEYDERNRRVAIVLPLLQRSETTYDAVGNVVKEKDFNQNTINYTYDDNNRVIAKEFVDGTSVSYTYTKTGQLETVTDSRGTTSYKYDLLNRLISRTDPNSPSLDTGATIEYEYDIAGNRTSVKTKAGTIKHTYDELNRLRTVTKDTDTTTYFYDAVGNLWRTKLSNGIIETRRYDQLNRLVSLKNVLTNLGSGEETIISSYDYTLNPVGYRLEVEEQNGRKVKYEYDELYRLSSEKITDPSDSVNNGRIISYTYDNVGNRLRSNDSVEGLTTYYYNNNDLLLNETQLKNGETVYTYNYTYDNNGNTISRAKNGNSETIYTWNFENRLIGVDNLLDGKQVDYVYDANGIRVSSTSDGITTNYLVDTNLPHAQVVAEYDSSGNLKTSYLYGHDLISQTKDGQQSFYLVDGLGSIRVLTDGQASITDTYTYDAFGKLIGSSGSTDNNYLFAGEQYDEDLEQYYLRQRYYDPNTGRFTRRDVYEGRLEEPLTLHKYLYANGNPANLIDPSGLNAILAMSPDASWGIAIVTTIIAVLTAVRMIEIGIELGSYIPETLKGIGDDPRLEVSDNTARKPDSELLQKLTGRLGGFAGDPQLEVSNTETFPSIPLSLSEYLENYVYSIYSDPGIDPEDYELDREAKDIAKKIYDDVARTHRTVAVGRIEGSEAKVVANSFGEFTDYQETLLRKDGYIVYEEKRGSYAKPDNHAERRLIRLQKSTGQKIEAIGVSHPAGICSSCWTEMQTEGIRRGSKLKPDKPSK